MGAQPPTPTCTTLGGLISRCTVGHFHYLPFLFLFLKMTECAGYFSFVSREPLFAPGAYGLCRRAPWPGALLRLRVGGAGRRPEAGGRWGWALSKQLPSQVPEATSSLPFWPGAETVPPWGCPTVLPPTVLPPLVRPCFVVVVVLFFEFSCPPVTRFVCVVSWRGPHRCRWQLTFCP